jgi:hypothetical protein
MTTPLQPPPSHTRSAPGSRKWFRTLLSLLGAVFLLLLVVEIVLRFGFGLGNPVLIQSDSACEYILKPDQDLTRFGAHTHINHYGMRSNEVAPMRLAGALRLLFLGDSVTYGTSRVDQLSIFTELLHSGLPAVAHEPVEVLNASASAWAPDNELGYVRSRGIFQSDIVLLVLNDGDLTQARATIADIGDNLPQKRPVTAIGEVFTRFLLPRFVSALSKTDAGDSVLQNAGQVMRQNLSNLAELQSLVESQGGRLVIVYIPFRIDIPDKSKPSAAVLEQWSKAHGVKLFNLTAAETPYTAKQMTLADGLHLNSEGHRVVAQAIEEFWPQLSESAH